MLDSSSRIRPYSHRTPDDYIQSIPPEILVRFDEEQLDEVWRVLERAIPKPSPKIVDLRFVIDLIFSRFYIVLFMGKDRRSQRRAYQVPRKLTRISNFIAAIILLINLNLFISLVILVILYLIKTAVGMSFSDSFHMQDVVQCLAK